MDKKFINLCFLLLLVCGLANANEDQKVTSKPEKITVFLTGAQVTRSAMVNIVTGTSTVTFQGISPDIDVQSIQVHAAGPFTILSVKQELNFLNQQTKLKQIEELQDQQKLIKDKITLQTDQLSIYKEEESMLLKNQVVSGQNVNLDVLKLQQALDFQTQRLTVLRKKQQVINTELAALNLELNKFTSQIADISRGSTKNTSDIIVTISSKVATRSQFTLSYLVHNAGWYPTYDIRAKDVNSPINIAYKANVSQQCGEEWKDVKLILSTGNPSVSGSKPELKPYYLNYGMVYSNQAENITRVTGRITDRTDGTSLIGVSVKVKGTSIGTASDANGNYSLQVPQGSQTLVFSYIGYETLERRVTSASMNVSLEASHNSLNEVVVTGYGSALEGRAAGVAVNSDKVRIRGAASMETIPVLVDQEENQTNVDFNINNPYSIPSDGKQYVVDIGQFDLNASFQYFVAPKLNTDVFLTAQLVDWNKYNFLSGEANLFFEDTYIGKSLLDTHSSSDTLNLSLGTDKNIVVTRTLQKNTTQRQIIGSNKKETKDWLIDVKNRKNQVINLLVEDQVPVSQNTAIEVEKQELSGGKINDLDGKLQWVLKLSPAEEKKLDLRYQVKYPKNQQVIVQ
ncbi:hypothetical protein BEL04_07600 [Mucilaginibacter sp. PPCGB 2223]|uniref:mucoidy inhibitor MuiA family protein n=1 Tax=Mucilaginibacter sp. PPCGB 2223 TaxID=1886027 RepID=UPI00082419CA|nr:mucoidy inhibitor MuiA family protein [Mucilaginibacter sp. PPCGB 2223]OCX54123.1 hypothetical protein BEL04_07600 [Mucilaginibacter sp. PPCGB 2223]